LAKKELYSLDELLSPSVKKSREAKPKLQPSETSYLNTVSTGWNNFWTAREEAQLWAEQQLSDPKVMERYRAYARTRPEIFNTEDKEWDDMTYDELREDFYEHGTFRNNNSVAMGRDLVDLGITDKKFKQEWTYFEQLFHAAPAWGKHRSGWAAIGDIGGAVITEPLNIFGGYGVLSTAIKEVNKAFTKQGIGGVLKDEYVKQVKKKAVKLGAVNVAKYNAYAGAGLDVLKQTNMKVANNEYEYDWSRTALSAGFSAAVGLPIGHVSSKINYSRVNPDVYFNKDTDWIKIDDLGLYNGAPILSLKEQSGYVANSDGVEKIVPVEKGAIVSDKDGNLGEVKKVASPDRQAVEKEVTIEFTDNKGNKTTKKVKESEVFVQTDPEVLPKNLSGASPKYFYRDSQIDLEFENDIVKALYIVGGRGKSAKHEEYLDFLKNNGVEDIETQSKALRNYIKTEAKKGITDVKIAAHHVKAKKALPKNVEQITGEGIDGVIKPRLSDEAKQIKNKADEVPFNRDVFRNRNQMTDEDSARFDSIMAFIKENYSALKGTNKYIKEFRIVTRKLEELLDDFAERAGMRISKQTRGQIIIDALDWAKTGKEGGVQLIAARLQNSLDMETLSQKIAQTKAAKTRGAQDEALKQEQKALDDVLESLVIADRLQTIMSDNLTAAKVGIKLTDAQRLKKQYIHETLKDMLKSENVNTLSPSKRHLLNEKIREGLGNDEVMYSLLRKYEQNKNENVNFGAWYNEFTTANLLGDPLTHTVNIASGLIKYHWDVGHNYITAMRLYSGGKLVEYNYFKSAGEKRVAQREIQMAKDIAALATDKFAMEVVMFKTAFDKAKLAWRRQSTVGDIYNTKYNDGRIERVHELYTDSLKKHNNVAIRAAGHIMSPLSKATYMTFRALGVGDTMLKQLHFNAARIAMVNHRMRKRYPELWAQNEDGIPTLRIKTQGQIEALEAAIRLEETYKGNRRLTLGDFFAKSGVDKSRNFNVFMTKKDRIQFYKDKIKALKAEDAKKEKTDFEKTWLEMFDEYQDEFGNFVSTDTFAASKLDDMDAIAKSPLFDPTYTARDSTFTQNLVSPIVPNAKDPVFNNTGGAGQKLLDWGYRYPLPKTLFGINFVRTPVQLNRFSWHYTPVLNKLHFQFRDMLNSPDPLVRSNAETTKAIAWSLYGMAFMLYQGGRLIGNHPDPEKRNSIKMADGTYVKHDRIFPFTHSLTSVAVTGDLMKEYGHIWDDPMHATATQKVEDFIAHTFGLTMSFLNTSLNSQLVTNQAFDLMEGVWGASLGRSEYEVQEAKRSFKSWVGSVSQKNVPLATTWKWANRELATADYELRSYLDKMASVSPFVTLAEITGDPRPFQPKRGRTYRVKDKVKGYVPMYGSTAWDNLFKYSAEDVKDVFKTQQGLERYLEATAKKLRPDTSYELLGREIADLNDLVVHEYVDPNTNKIVKAREGQTFADLRLQLAGEFKVSGKGIEDYLSELLDNPKSAFYTKVTPKVIGGQRDDFKIILGIHTAFETAAKHYLVKNAYSLTPQGKKIRPLLDGLNRFESIYKSEYFEYQKKAEQAIQALTDPYK
jgi:hypothetical protein